MINTIFFNPFIKMLLFVEIKKLQDRPFTPLHATQENNQFRSRLKIVYSSAPLFKKNGGHSKSQHRHNQGKHKNGIRNTQ